MGLSSNRRTRRSRGWLAVALLILSGGGAFFWLAQPGGEVAEDEDLIVTVRFGDIENLIPTTGSLQPKEIVPVGARASGELENAQNNRLNARTDLDNLLIQIEQRETSLQQEEVQLDT